MSLSQVLAEFQGVQEHRQFMKNIGKEKELKSRIKDLQRLVYSSVSAVWLGVSPKFESFPDDSSHF